MTDKELLKLFSKKELIELILKAADKGLMIRLRTHAADLYIDRENKVVDMQEALDLKKPEDRIKYQELEKEYKKLDECLKKILLIE